MTARKTRPVTRLALALAALMLAGCEQVGDAMGLTGTVGAVRPQLIGPERIAVTLGDRGAQAILGPVSRMRDVTVWQTGDGITLGFRDGVLTGTRGLGDDLMSADVSGDLAMLRDGQAKGHYPHIRAYLDGEDQTVFRSYECRRTAQRVETDGATAAMRRVEVRCTSTKDSFTNVYVLDASGTVAGSRQWVSPVVGYMETQRVAR